MIVSRRKIVRRSSAGRSRAHKATEGVERSTSTEVYIISGEQGEVKVTRRRTSKTSRRSEPAAIGEQSSTSWPGEGPVRGTTEQRSAEVERMRE